MNYNISCIYGLGYESVLNTHQKEENKVYCKSTQTKRIYKNMEGHGGYFLEPGGYIVDKRNTKDQPKKC
jgi:hypothetical protein